MDSPLLDLMPTIKQAKLSIVNIKLIDEINLEEMAVDCI